MYRRYNPLLPLLPAALLGVLPLAAAQAQTMGADGVHAQQASPTNALLSRQPLPGVFSAGQPTADDWAGIANAGVGTVIDLRPDSERPQRDEAGEVRKAGMHYVQIPVAGPQDLGPQAATALWHALQVAQKDGGQVLVHCASANRAGALLALAMAQHGGRSSAQALQLGREAGMTSTAPRVRELLGVEAAAQPQK